MMIIFGSVSIIISLFCISNKPYDIAVVVCNIINAVFRFLVRILIEHTSALISNMAFTIYKRDKKFRKKYILKEEFEIIK